MSDSQGYHHGRCEKDAGKRELNEYDNTYPTA